MKQIFLTNGMHALVDDTDYENLIAMGNWYYSDRYAKLSRAKPRMHQIIMNAPKGMCVDHKNGNPLDNRRCNLRICTRSQNSCNKGKPKSNTSGYKGVTWQTREQKYYCKLMVNKRVIPLGYFTCPVEAAKAYNEAALKYHGEFAYLNPV